MKSLARAQTVFKIWKTVALICSVVCFVGAAGCLLGGVLLLCGVQTPIGSETLAHFFLSVKQEFPAELDMFHFGLALVGETFFILAQGLVLFFEYRYAQKVLTVGNPFARDCVRHLSVTGIRIMGAILFGNLISGIILAVSGTYKLVQNDYMTMFGLGALLFLLSFVFEYAADLLENQKPNEEAEAEGTESL